MNEDKREYNRATFAQLLKQLKENMPAQLEFQQLTAKLTRAKYLALVAEGFTESQALDLCKEYRS